MKRRQWLILSGLLFGVGGALLVWLTRSAVFEDGGAAFAPSPAGPSEPMAPKKAPSSEDRRRLLAELPEAHLADDLNAPGGTIQSDLAILASLFAAYRSIYNTQGNPIGDNREITHTFLGHGLNRSEIPFLKAGHRAINESGELCDRWGTPFLFHAESGTRMEIRSAGPDRVPRTSDDVLVVP